MPSKSKKQQKAMGMALAVKRGKMPMSKMKGSAKKMYESMSEEQLEEFAETKRKKLPEKVSKHTVWKRTNRKPHKIYKRG